MNANCYESLADWHDSLIATWRVEWLKAIDEFLRPTARNVA